MIRVTTSYRGKKNMIPCLTSGVLDGLPAYLPAFLSASLPPLLSFPPPPFFLCHLSSLLFHPFPSPLPFPSPIPLFLFFPPPHSEIPSCIIFQARGKFLGFWGIFLGLQMLDIEGSRGGLQVNPRAFCMLGKHSSAEQHPPTLSPWFLENSCLLSSLASSS